MRIYSLYTSFKAPVAGLLLSMFITGCGGGGGGSKTPPPPPSPPPPPPIVISGGGIKGPLTDAIVTVFGFDATAAGFKGVLIDSGTTDSTTAITGLSLPSPTTPPYIMEINSDETTRDITTGAVPIITTMSTVITQQMLDSGLPIYATPITTFAVSLAVSNADSNILPWTGNNDSTTSAAEFLAALSIAADQTLSTVGFGADSTVDIFATPPLINADTVTTEEQQAVAMYRSAVESIAAILYQISEQTSASNPGGVLAELVADLADDNIINGSAGDLINILTLEIFGQNPLMLNIPNSLQTVLDVQTILDSETSITGSTTITVELTDGTIVTTTLPAQTNPDSDGDGVLNAEDDFPEDASESVDTDGDGIGDNRDVDDDNDGILDIDEGTEPVVSATDADGDTIADDVDNCPTTFNTSQTDTDADAEGDACDIDDDNDGTDDTKDAFQLDASESIDTDSDGIGNNADLDDDNDGILDLDDTGLGIDGFTACALLADCDGDGSFDAADDFPQNPAEQRDTDADGIGNNEDTDDDGDGISDIIEIENGTKPLVADTDGDTILDDVDNCPITANTDQVDSNNNGVGDACSGAAPVFESAAITLATEDQLYTYTLSSTDAENDAITLTTSALPGWLSFVVDTAQPVGTGVGTLAGTPANGDVGSHQVTISATSNGVSTDQLFTIVVSNVNDFPIITSTPPSTNLIEGDSFSYTITATDEDVGDTLTYSTSTLPGWLNFNTGSITLESISGAVASSFSVTITVTDDGIVPSPLSDTQILDFVITVPLNCSYESGWDDNADGGLGRPINPNSFAEYELALKSCGTAMSISAADVKGKTHTSDDGEITVFDDTLAAATATDRGTGNFQEPGLSLNFEWYIEAATCSGCTHDYLVLFTDPSIDPQLTNMGLTFFRDTRAVTSVNGNSQIMKIYSEQSNFSDADRATGADGEIWNYSVTVTSDTPPAPSLACDYESGWDDNADGGLGRPINPNSFAEYEGAINSCGGAMSISASDIKGKTYTDIDGETTVFDNTSAAATSADRGTGRIQEPGLIVNFEWYIEAATCSGCTHDYIVLYVDPSIDSQLGDFGLTFIRDTRAVTSVNGNSQILKIYSEASNYSDSNRGTGADGEIWNLSVTVAPN